MNFMFLRERSARIVASLGLLSLATLAACAQTQNTVMPAQSASLARSQGGPIPTVAALTRHPHAECAPVSTTYGPVLADGQQTSGLGQVLTVSDASTTETIVDATMSIVNGATSGANGTTSSGSTKVTFYDYSGNPIATQYPTIGGYVGQVTTGEAFTPYPSCNLTRVTFDYTYTWTITYPSFEQGTVEQTAQLTYPHVAPTPSPTAKPTPVPTPTPTPAACATLSADLSTASARLVGMLTANTNIESLVNNKSYSAALSQLQAFSNRDSDFDTAAFAFDVAASSAFHVYVGDHQALTGINTTLANDYARGSQTLVPYDPVLFWEQAEADANSANQIVGASFDNREHTYGVYCQSDL